MRTEEMDHYAIIIGNDKWHTKRADGTDVMLLFDKGNLLTGANKSVQYIFGIFGELFYRFFTKLRNTDRLVISGYGWNDFAINKKLFEWLNLNKKAKIFLIHKNVDDLINNSRYLNATYFLDLIKSNKIIVSKKWFEQATMDEILEFYSA